MLFREYKISLQSTELEIIKLGLVNDIENRVRDYLAGDYEVTSTENIPSVEEVAFGKKAKKMNLCAFCIDLRNSSDLLSVHHKQTSGKIHKAFLTAVAKVVLHYGGVIRSFQGDSLLAFWPAQNKTQISSAVEAAMVTKWFLDVKFSPLFEKYSKLDFGIGIDWGEVFIVRAGISRDANTNDLVFIGECVNFATKIADQAKDPYHVEISERTYNKLTKKMIYSTQDNGREVDMWEDGSVEFKDEMYDTKYTEWYNTIE